MVSFSGFECEWIVAAFGGLYVLFVCSYILLYTRSSRSYTFCIYNRKSWEFQRILSYLFEAKLVSVRTALTYFSDLLHLKLQTFSWKEKLHSIVMYIPSIDSISTMWVFYCIQHAYKLMVVVFDVFFIAFFRFVLSLHSQINTLIFSHVSFLLLFSWRSGFLFLTFLLTYCESLGWYFSNVHYYIAVRFNDGLYPVIIGYWDEYTATISSGSKLFGKLCLQNKIEKENKMRICI